MSNKINYYGYHDLSKIASTLSGIKSEKLKGGYEVQISNDNNFLTFSKPWKFQKVSAWSSSSFNGVSQKDQRMIEILNTWSQSILGCTAFTAGQTGLTQTEIENWNDAYVGLVNLAKHYDEKHSNSKGAYYDSKRATVTSLLNIASQYKRIVLEGNKSEKHVEILNVDDVTESTKFLIQLNNKYKLGQ